MDELNLKDYLPEVKAPADFEARVLAAVAARKEKRKSFLRFPRLSLSWPLAAMTVSLALLLTLSFLFFPKLNWFRTSEEAAIFSSSAAETQPGRPLLTLTEPVDFQEEFSGLPGPKVVYILEPVDDRFLREIKY